MFGSDAPSFGKLKAGLTEVRQTMHVLLREKREKEPDPVEAIAPIQSASNEAELSGEDVPAVAGGTTVSSFSTETA